MIIIQVLPSPGSAITLEALISNGMRISIEYSGGGSPGSSVEASRTETVGVGVGVTFCGAVVASGALPGAWLSIASSSPIEGLHPESVSSEMVKMTNNRGINELVFI